MMQRSQSNNQGHHYGYVGQTSAHGGHISHGGQMQVQVSHVAGGQNVRKVSEVVTSEKFKLPMSAYEQSQRKVSSVVIFEEAEQVPERNVRYNEVPQYEEVVKHVPRKEIREVEKIVPRIVEEWVERIVEVPQIEEVVRHVEVPQYEEVIRHVPRIEVVDRPYEVEKKVPKVMINKVEKVVELPAEVVEVPKPVLIEERVAVTNYDDRDAMLVISQKVKPVIIDHGVKEIVVDVVEYEPEVMPVDIHVAKFVEQELVMMGVKETIHRVVTVPAAQYNSMLRYLNIHLSPDEVAGLPYLADAYGQVSFLPKEFQWFPPQDGLKIYGYRNGVIWGEGQVVATAKSPTGITELDIRNKQAELDRQFQQIFHQFEQERVRRVSLIDEFNRQATESVRYQLAQHNHHNRHHSDARYSIGHQSHHIGGSLTYDVNLQKQVY